MSAAEDGDIIGISSGTFTLTTGRTLTIDKDIELIGDGLNKTIIEGGTHPSIAESPVFTITAGAIVIIRDVQIRHGNSLNNGGGIESKGTLTIKDSWVHDNWAQSAGGGIWNRGGFFGEGVLTIIDSQIDFNRAANAGGGRLYRGNRDNHRL